MIKITKQGVQKCRVTLSSLKFPQIRLSSTLDTYQFLEQSKVPTMHFQKSLPRLPIPTLKNTCDRYLSALNPILTPEEFSETENVVRAFETHEGIELDKKLRNIDSNQKRTSYISKPWFDMYLSDRTPLVLNYNPAMVFVNSNPPNNNQLARATNMVISSLRFMKSLRANCLAPEVFHLNPKKSDTPLFYSVTSALPASLSWYGAYLFKAYPLDMSQYYSLFNSTRIPKKGCDILRRDESGRHILVLRKGNFFKVDVLDENANILSPVDIKDALANILSMKLEKNALSPGVLTAQNRDTWADLREHLIKYSADNARIFSLIDNAILVLCLDEEKLHDKPTEIMRNFLHGDGLNRWFDKSFNLIVGADGMGGVNFEHSWGDGVAILRYFQDILKDSDKQAFVDGQTGSASQGSATHVQELSFDIDEATKNMILASKADFDKRCNSIDFNVVQVEGFGKRDCKGSNLSPDSVMQLAFQVVYHKIYNDFVATYESCSTAAFLHGRTETVRPNTNATKQFVLAYNSKNRPSNQELIKLMQECSKVHGTLTKEAALGQGFDRHLFALRHIAQNEGQIPKIFEHFTYKKINQNVLSTSTLSSPAVMVGGFGPVVPDGYGIGYNILDNHCGASISSYPPARDGAAFVHFLNDTLIDFSKILKNSK